MYPVRNPYNGFPVQNQMANYGDGIRFQHNSPLPLMGLPPQHMWMVSPRPPMIQQKFQRNHQYNNNYRGKRRRSPPSSDSSKKAKVQQDDNDICETYMSKQTEKVYKVPVSKGSEQITQGIWNHFLASEMPRDVLDSKLKLRKVLHTIFEDAFKGCRLFIVGSTMTGFSTATSDLDMCLMISEKYIDQKKDALTVLQGICSTLREASFVQESEVVRAKVPILRFRMKAARSLECDLNVNNTIGIRNTHLLRHYAYLDWRVRPLMLFIKRWARYHDINDARKNTISSYSLSLMLIHYLQAGISPPVLPCLHKLQPNIFNPETDVRKLSMTMEDVASDYFSENVATLGELFLGFLNYYANLHNYNHVISVRTGTSFSLQEAYHQHGIDVKHWKWLRIEEPFERSNTARAVFDQHVFWRVLRVINASFKILNQTRNVESILSRPF